MRVLILGANGYLGRPLYRAFNETVEYEVYGTSKSSSRLLIQLDITDKSAPTKVISFLKDSEDTVLFLSAISKPELCQSDFVYAFQVNVTSTKEIISRILENGNRVLFFSSDTVYGEQHTPVYDNAPLSPFGTYALMKYGIEEEFLQCENFKSIRISYVYSPNDPFTKYLRSTVDNDYFAEVYHPFSRAMIFRDDLIEGVISLVRNWETLKESSINFGGPETISRVRYAEALKDVMMPGLKYKAVSPPKGFYSQRPQVINMQSDLLIQLLGRNPRGIKQIFESEDFVREWRDWR